MKHLGKQTIYRKMSMAVIYLLIALIAVGCKNTSEKNEESVQTSAGIQQDALDLEKKNSEILTAYLRDTYTNVPEGHTLHDEYYVRYYTMESDKMIIDYYYAYVNKDNRISEDYIRMIKLNNRTSHVGNGIFELLEVTSSVAQEENQTLKDFYASDAITTDEASEIKDLVPDDTQLAEIKKVHRSAIEKKMSE